MESKKTKFLKGFKKYGYYAMAGVLMVAIGITAGVIANKDDVEQPVVGPVLEFVLPLDNPEVLKWFSATELFYNNTLEQWESHKAVDMTSTVEDVCSVLDGTITSIETSYEHGTTITITHEGGFVSKYSCLDETVAVVQGDKIKKGSKIGKISDSANTESKDGKHLHFELFKDGAKVDPASYLTLDDK